jgi:2-polyprenyl-3-methyl-5-hydroxy-6-metoxy-1,4-benzoquinol methylase
MFELIKLNKPLKHIDVGCGDGRLINELSLIFKKIKLIGLDYDKKAIDWAKKFKISNNVKFYKKKISELKIKTDSISLIEVLEHIPITQVKNFLKTITNTLYSDGNLYITVPHINKKIIDKHYQHFSFNSIMNLLAADFNIKEIKSFDKKIFFFSKFNFIFKNRFYFFESNFINKIIFLFKYKFYNTENNAERIFVHATKK